MEERRKLIRKMKALRGELSKYIYVASSWRNPIYDIVYNAICNTAAKHYVYNFKNPATDNHGFHWRDIISTENDLKIGEKFREILNHPIAEKAFMLDMRALQYADIVILVLPCGRSAHLEMGYAVGSGKRCYILLDNPISEPELMYKMIGKQCPGKICTSLEELIKEIG